MNTPKWVDQLKQLLLLVLDYVPPVYVWGPPSTGKTWLCLNVFPGDRPVAVTLHRGQPIEELRGMYVPGSGGFEWVDGPIVDAMKRGKTLVVNEVGEASDDVISLLYAVLDRPESCAYTLPTGELVKPASGFRVIATGNSDPSELPEAIRSRFAIQLNAAEPNPEAVSNLPERYRDAALSTMTQAGERAIDPRRWQALLDLERAFGSFESAARIVFGDEASAAVLDAMLVANEARKS